MQSEVKQEGRLGDGKVLARRKHGSSSGSTLNHSTLAQRQGRKIWSEFRYYYPTYLCQDDDLVVLA